jgi:hypothetical protein
MSVASDISTVLQSFVGYNSSSELYVQAVANSIAAKSINVFFFTPTNLLNKMKVLPKKV